MRLCGGRELVQIALEAKNQWATKIFTVCDSYTNVCSQKNYVGKGKQLLSPVIRKVNAIYMFGNIMLLKNASNKKATLTI